MVCREACELGDLMEKSHTIPRGKQECFQKIKSWLIEEGVELAIREYLLGAGESTIRSPTV